MAEDASRVESLLVNDKINDLSWLDQNVWDEKREADRNYHPETANVLVYRKANELIVSKTNTMSRPYAQMAEEVTTNKVSLRASMLLLDYTDALEPILPFAGDKLPIYLELLKKFIDDYFNFCPLSIVGIFALCKDDVISVGGLSCSAETLKMKLTKFFDSAKPDGFLGLAGAIERARNLLNLPQYASYGKDIVFINASITTIDGTLIDESRQRLQRDNITFSSLTFASAVYAFEKLCMDTGGRFLLANTPHQVKHALFQLSNAPSEDVKEPVMLRIGFPEYIETTCAQLCTCHSKLHFTGYKCPQCLQLQCELPALCSCGLQLCANLDIRRCHRTRAAPLPFDALPANKIPAHCQLCDQNFISGGGKCRKCSATLCLDCDAMIHFNGLSCPGCLRSQLRTYSVSSPP